MPKCLLLLPVLLSLNCAAFAQNLCPQGRSIERVSPKELKEHKIELRLSEEIVVRLVERSIVPNEKSQDYCKDKTVGLVNGATPFGEGGNPRSVPYSYLAKLTLHVKGKTYALQTTNMYNAWGDRPLEHNGQKYMAAHCYDADTCVLRGIFSSTGGLYVAEWRIGSGKSFRTILSDSTDVVDFFMKGGINPPVFE